MGHCRRWWRSNSAPRPFQPAALETFPAIPGTETIHDLLVEFDAEGASEYVAGDAVTKLVVSSEAPRFGAAPEAAAAMLDMIGHASPAIEAALAPVPAAQRSDLLYRGLRYLSTRLLPDAIRMLPAGDRLTASAVVTAAPAIGLQAARAASALIATREGQPRYDNGRGAVFAALMAMFGDEFNDAIAMGWRDFSPPPASAATTLALSLLSLELVATVALPDGAAITPELTLGDAAPVALPPIGPFPARAFHHQLLAATYHADVLPPGAAPVWLHVGFRLPDGAMLPFAARAALLGPAAEGYRLVSAPILDACGDLVGQLSLDLRRADTGLAGREGQAKAAWTAQKRALFARALSRQAGALLAVRFAATIQPFLVGP